ncbi:tape measure protein [Corynebacterium auriscanis]|uniref:Tape measure protein N-terminal domain-containing protein n=1 Tax=Corynebacterium auriscanis TaxID=99807 RepID=A0A0A2DG34_9CORY|nr:tape measure protein [Corynebacterium auriscanis]KGM18143.1 hypothetical protein MA47_09650 [Corynebacterium auriscanis]WJY73217.1 hypothetical protein CAURIC_08020 [Corynebacterium auriscanis]
MVQLANAWVVIKPSTKDIAPAVKQALGEADSSAVKSGESMGTKLSSGIGKTLKRGALAAGAAAGSALGYTLKKGFDRLSAIEGAQAKLKGLGHSTQNVGKIMDSALNSVKGTAYGLGDAAGLAAQMVASGIKPGQELEGVLKTVGDTAAIAGRDISDVGLIFGSVAARGKLQGDDMMQLMSSGIPVLQLLAKETGKTSEEISEMVSDGQIDFKTFEKAMKAGMGGAALEMGKTFSGSVMNAKAAVGRLGETLLKGPFNVAPAIIGNATKAIDGLTDKVRGVFEYFEKGYQGDAFKKAFPDAQVANEVARTLDSVKQKFDDFMSGLKGNNDAPGMFGALGESARKIKDAFVELAPSVGKIIASLGQGAMAASIVSMTGAFATLAPLLANILAPILEKIAQLMTENQGAVNGLVTGFVAFKGISFVTGLFGGVAGNLRNVGGAAKFLGGALSGGGGLGGIMLRVAGGFKSANPIIAGIGKTFVGLGSKLINMGSLFSRISGIGSKIGSVFLKVGGSLARFAGVLKSGLVTGLRMAMGAFRALTAAMLANPMVLIATAIAAVVAGLIWFFTKTETGKRIWGEFIQALKDAWSWLANKFTQVWSDVSDAASSAWEGIKSAWSATGDFFTGVWDGVKSGASGVWDGIKSGASGAWDGIKSAASGAFDGLKNAVTATRDWLSENWTTVLSILGGPIGMAVSYIVTHWEQIRDAFASGVETVKNLWNGLWNGLVAVASAVWNGITTTLSAAWNGLVSIAGAVWNGLKALIVGVWNGIRAGVIAVWNGLSIAIVAGWNAIKGMAIAVWNGVKAVIVGVWNGLRAAVLAILGFLRDGIVNGWSAIKSASSAAWNAIKAVVLGAWNAVKAGVIAAVNALKSAISNFVNSARNSFNNFIQIVSGIPGRIKGIFAAAGSWLVNAGRDIISGLVSGIRSAGSIIGDAIRAVVPDRLEGFIGLSLGGVIEAYAQGGVKRFGRGGKENHSAQIAKAGAWRVWAEPETGGEAYIPLAGSKRARSTAILSQVADMFGLSVVSKDTGAPVDPRYRGSLAPKSVNYFADGGITAGDVLQWVRGKTVKGMRAPAGRSLEGFPYTWGGGSAGNWGDCSGMISLVAGFVKGLWRHRPLARLFATGSQGSVLASMGAKRGLGGRNDFNIGWFNGGPYGGHTAGDVGGIAIEMGGARGNGQIGGRAASARHPSFTDHAHFKLSSARPETPWRRPSADSTAGMAGGSAAPLAGGVPAGAAVGDSFGGSTSVSWGKAQDLYTQAAEYLGVGKASYAARQTDQNVSGTTATDARDPHTPNKRTGVPQGDKPRPTSKWGQPFFAFEIARSAKSKHLPARGAMIGIGTALVESGDPLKMWANRAVPESMAFKHDAVGSDYDSVGLFQQRNNGAWGTTADRMSPFRSAGMFFNAMLRKFPKWQQMDPGAVAQGVQVSAFPGRYAGKMGRAMQLVKSTGLYDQGGVLPHRGLSVNLSRKPEAVLTNSQWGNFARSTRATEDLVVVLKRGMPEFQVLSRKGPDAWLRTAVAVEKIAATGDYTGNAPFAKDSVFTEIALRLYEVRKSFENEINKAMGAVKRFGLTLGGEFIGKSEIVRDAEEGLAQTREQIAAETVRTADLEEDLAKKRISLIGARSKSAALTTVQTRKLADAEEALRDARAVKDSAKRAKAIAKAQKRLDRVNEDIAESLEKSSEKNAKVVQKAMDDVAKAEGKLTEAQLKQADAAIRLEAAERTVAASRYKAIGELATGVLDSVAKGAGTVAEYAGAMAKLASEVEKTRQEVSKLALANVNNRIATLEAVNALRTSETDLARARWDGYVSIARAEAALAKERKGHLTMGAASVANLADAVDRFRVAGVAAVDDILLTWVQDQDLVMQAEWALKQARAEAALAQQEATIKQQLAQFNLAAATMEQVHIAQQLRLQTALLAQQQAATFGVGVHQMGALQRMGQAVQKIFTGIAKIVGGIAMGVAGFAVGGPLGAIPGAVTALSGIPDLVGGISGAVANKKAADEAWKKLDPAAKAGAGFGIAGAALSGLAGIAGGTVGGLGPEAITGGFQVGNSILDATFGSMSQIAETKMEAINAEHQKRLDEMQRSYELDKAILESQKSGLQAGSSATLEKLKLDIEVAKLSKELAKARADKDDAVVISALERAVAEATKRQGELAAMSASNQARLDAATHALTQAARESGKQVNITLTGDGYSSSQVEELLNSVAREYGDMNLRITRLEDKNAPGALDYASARR